MPLLVTRAQVAAGVKNRFAHQYGPDFRVYPFGDSGAIYKALVALGDSPEPADVERLIPGWTQLLCDECGHDVDIGVQVGQEPDYDSSTAVICRNCAKMAVELFNSVGEPPSHEGRS